MTDLIAFLTARVDEDEAQARRVQAALDAGWNYFDETPTELIDPARALREVEAKRVIVDLAAKTQQWTEGSAGATAGYASVVVSDTLRALAAIYRSHPDYHPDWAPST